MDLYCPAEQTQAVRRIQLILHQRGHFLPPHPHLTMMLALVACQVAVQAFLVQLPDFRDCFQALVQSLNHHSQTPLHRGIITLLRLAWSALLEQPRYSHQHLGYQYQPSRDLSSSPHRLPREHRLNPPKRLVRYTRQAHFHQYLMDHLPTVQHADHSHLSIQGLDPQWSLERHQRRYPHYQKQTAGIQAAQYH